MQEKFLVEVVIVTVIKFSKNLLWISPSRSGHSGHLVMTVYRESLNFYISVVPGNKTSNFKQNSKLSLPLSAMVKLLWHFAFVVFHISGRKFQNWKNFLHRSSEIESVENSQSSRRVYNNSHELDWGLEEGECDDLCWNKFFTTHWQKLWSAVIFIKV